MECKVCAKDEIDWDAPIFQYMRLDYLISLLATKQYYVRPRCEFEDAFEANLPLKNMFPIHEACKDVDKEVLKGELDAMSIKMKAHRENGRLLTSCWSLKAREDILMWNCYASKIGVRVKSTLRRFLSALKTEDYEILCGRMDYTGYSFYNDNSFFTKDIGYESEEEFRFYFYPKASNPDTSDVNPKPVRIDIEPREFIENVTLSPYIKTCSASELSNILKERYGIVVRQSALKINR